MSEIFDKANAFVTKFLSSMSENFDDESIKCLLVEWEKREKDFKKTLKKTKAKKDKNAPKKRSSYLIFCADMRPKVKEHHPHAINTELIKLLATMWNEHKEAKDDVYEKYTVMAKEEKDNYVEAVKNYVPVPEEPKVKKPRAKKHPDAPKSARSAYVFFCKDNRTEMKTKHPDLKGPEITKLLAANWKEHKEAEDKVYKQYDAMAKKDKERYTKEMAEWVPPLVEESDEEIEIAENPKEVTVVITDTLTLPEHPQTPEEEAEEIVREMIGNGDDKVTKKAIKEAVKNARIDISVKKIGDIINKVVEELSE